MDSALFKNDKRKKMLYQMMLIREFEHAVSEHKLKNEIYGMAHCYTGQEAIAVGVCEALNDKDIIVSNHRPHGHAIAKGVDVDRIMLEMCGKENGTNGGKGGSMHINSPKDGLYTSSGIVASGIPVACGIAFALKYKNEKNVVCVFLGDGATNEGVFHESINIASKWELPVIFILENNGLAITVKNERTTSYIDYIKWASTYGVHACKVDGQSVQEVNEEFSKLKEYVLSNSKPALIECDTIRFNEHAEGAYYLQMKEKNYRDNSVLETQKKERDPITCYKNKLIEDKTITEEDYREIKKEITQRIIESWKKASEASYPDVKRVYENLFS